MENLALRRIHRQLLEYEIALSFRKQNECDKSEQSIKLISAEYEQFRKIKH